MQSLGLGTGLSTTGLSDKNEVVIERDGTVIENLCITGKIHNISLNNDKELEISFGHHGGAGSVVSNFHPAESMGLDKSGGGGHVRGAGSELPMLFSHEKLDDNRRLIKMPIHALTGQLKQLGLNSLTTLGDSDDEMQVSIEIEYPGKKSKNKKTKPPPLQYSKHEIRYDRSKRISNMLDYITEKKEEGDGLEDVDQYTQFD